MTQVYHTNNIDKCLSVCRRTGFGMLEMIIAIGIMVVILGASAILQKNAIKNTVISSERAQAYNLAREGIEAVRAIRDSKWLDQIKNDWNEGLTIGIPYDVDLDGEGYWQLNSAPALIQLTFTKHDDVTNQDIVTNTSPEFTRAITFEQIGDSVLQNLLDIVNSGQPTAVQDEHAIIYLQQKTIKVNVTVDWVSYGQPRTVTAYEYLTDWKPGH